MAKNKLFPFGELSRRFQKETFNKIVKYAEQEFYCLRNAWFDAPNKNSGSGYFNSQSGNIFCPSGFDPTTGI